MAADLVTIATTVVLTQFITPAAKNLGEIALERAKQIGSKAVDYLVAVGREPQPVEPKILLPLVQAASLETDELLTDHWAALLANAADPARRVAMQPGFIEVLRQLTTDDAQLLLFIYSDHKLKWLTVHEVFAYFDWVGDRTELSLDNLLRLRIGELLVTGERGESLELSANQRILPTAYGRHFLAAVTPPTI